MSDTTPAWAKNMRKLGPGVYATKDRVIHVSEAEICAHLGVPYTRAHSKIIEQAVRAVVEQDCPGITITRHEDREQ